MSDIHYSIQELTGLGVTLGNNVLIHRSVIFFSPENIVIGDNVRIDCFSVLSAGDDGIRIGNQVHIAAGVHIFGAGGKVVIEDFCGISGKVSLYTVSDDYSEGYLTNPTIPDDYRKLTQGPISLGKHVIIGCNSVVMPKVRIGIAASVGALSFVNRNVPDFAIVTGNPTRLIGHRNKRIIELEKRYLSETGKI